MSYVGIVGHEAAKFTPETEALAREVIRFLLSPPDAILVSGHCHLGGIDIWAEEEAAILGRGMEIFAPETLTWEDRQASDGYVLDGFKTRNLYIAETSTVCHCLVVRDYPAGYTGAMKFGGCYHCVKRVGGPGPHVKSGGCWTAWRAKNRAWWIL